MEQQDSAQDSHQIETLFDLPKHRDRAVSELYWAVRHSGVSGPGGLIGLTSRRIIQEALTSDGFYGLHNGFRQESTRETWKSLVQEASRRPLSLGFIRFDQGIPGLAGMLRRDHTTLSRNLKTWSEQRAPLVIVDKMKQPGRKPFAYMIQIPTLTEWLSFTASAKGFAETGMPGVMTWSQIGHSQKSSYRRAYLRPLLAHPSCLRTQSVSLRLLTQRRCAGGVNAAAPASSIYTSAS